MQSEKRSTLTPKASPAPRQHTSSISEMLTPSELDSLRRDKIETGAYAQKAFAHLRPKAKTPAE